MLLQARTGARGPVLKNRVPWLSRPAVETRILLGLTVLAAVLRFATISSQSYWLDESQAAHELRLSFGAMLGAWNSAEWNPPLYLILAWPWARVFGTGEAGLRSLSALLGVGVVPLLYLCGRELVSRRAGLVAAGLAAVSPFMIWYSQEAREYMLLVFLCTGSILFFARAWRTPSPRQLLWWAVFSGLALLTQYFAGFLVAAEGVGLLYRSRNRGTLLALGAMAVVEAPLIPHVLPRLRHPAQFIVEQALSLRLQQVPVTFGLNTLYLSPIVSYGLIGAAVLAAIVIALLVIGADGAELRGVAIAAALAAAVLLVPLLLALVGHDDYIARGLMPAWPLLAIVLGAACTGRQARVGGGLLAAALVVMFVYAGIRIDGDARYQRPNWRAVAAALGTSEATRAIVAYDGQFATGPLSVYLTGVPWSGPGGSLGTDSGPVTVSEVDIVGSTADRLARLPLGISRLAAHAVDGYQVVRLRLSSPWHTTAPAIGNRATALLGPAPLLAPVMIQRGLRISLRR